MGNILIYNQSENTRVIAEAEVSSMTWDLDISQIHLRSPLISLEHSPDAKIPSPRSAGLFHFAILLPDRGDLAATYLALKGSGIRFDGFADHLVTESLYLRDPENNGIEIYRDRPSEDWSRDNKGRLVMDS